ncbi:hypothetical protein [Streptomyces sp. NPDC052107]|uniref:hypothetical protein n=1 Tax=Streptomyces sp. NPDC052107 TaxID=3155632 RepID=UPI0034400EC1
MKRALPCDYCGTAPPLETDAAQQQAGRKNGDIGYAGGWFALLFDGQEHSQSCTGMMISGHVDTVRALDRDHAVQVVDAEGRSLTALVPCRQCTHR